MTFDKRAAELRQLRRELVAAGDDQIRRLVAVIDAVTVRGEADTLVAPLRPRLAMLRPPRPLQFVRMLYLPLDPLVMAPSVWRPGAVGIPRVVLRPLAGVISAGMGEAADALAERMRGHSTAEPDAIEAIGGDLWAAAAAALRATTAEPPGWTDASGLHAGEFLPLANNVATLLAEGPALWRLANGREPEGDATQGERLLVLAAAAGAQALAMMLALLLARLPHAGHLVQFADDLAARGNDGTRVSPDRALEFLLAGIESAAAPAQTPHSMDDLRHAAVLLESIVGQSLNKPSRINRLERARRELDATCRRSFDATAASLAPGQQPDAAEVAALESTALHLRRVEAVGRRLGSVAHYDKSLQQTAERLKATPGLSAIDRLRLAEILLGPDAALSMFGMA